MTISNGVTSEVKEAFKMFLEAEHRWLFDSKVDDYDTMRFGDSISNFWKVFYEK